MTDLLRNVKSGPGCLDGRSMGTWTRNGRSFSGLLEWTATAPEAFLPCVESVKERIPTDDDIYRQEETHTLKIDGHFSEGGRIALVYRCPQQRTDLRDILLNIPKPTPDDRRALSRIIATQIRSLHVHFRLRHPALRTQSFVFLGAKPDLTKPYILDWACSSSPSMYQHPEYPGKPSWYCEAWSLMMILSEIAEWQPLDGGYREEAELLRKKLERKKLVMDPEWKGAATAKIFRYGFGNLEKNRHTLEQFSTWDVKRFYDGLCELLAPLSAQ